MNIENLSGETATPELAASPVAPEVTATAYQAPAIESVVTFDNLQREVFYAGAGTTQVVPIP